jgi:uncharacterized membrane protein
MVLLLALHVLAATIWVGGMFFAYAMLRPAAGALEPAVRLALWRGVFGRFFPWVWASVVALLASGFAMILVYLGGFRGLGAHIQVMMTLGILMVLIFFHLYFVPWRRFRAAVERNDLPAAGRNLEQIRLIVAVNLVLGLIVVGVGATGRLWG